MWMTLLMATALAQDPAAPEAPPTGVGEDAPADAPAGLPSVDGISFGGTPVTTDAPVVDDGRFGVAENSYQGPEFMWSEVGPAVGGAMYAVAIHPTDPDTWVSLGRGGAVWVTRDGGLNWRSVLAAKRDNIDAGGGSDEDLLLGVEARVEELVGGGGDDGDDDFAEDLADATGEAVQNVQSEIGTGRAWFLDQDEAGQARTSRLPAGLWFGPDGTLLVGRPDGLWLSRDLTNFRQVLDVGTGAMVWLPEQRLWVAGTVDGFRFSLDGESWIDSLDGSEGVAIHALAATSIGVFAGTETGLWYAPDGETWSRRLAIEEPVVAVFVDPVDPQKMWLSVGRTLLRSTNGGLSFREPLSIPLPGVTSIVGLQPGHMLLASGDGTWESLNGGLSWNPVTTGLLAPDTHAISARGARILLAGEEGLHRLGPIPEGAADDMITEATEWVPLGLLLTASRSRRGLGTMPRNWRVKQYAVPRVRGDLRFHFDDDQRNTRAALEPFMGNQWTVYRDARRSIGNDVRIEVWLEWGRNGTNPTNFDGFVPDVDVSAQVIDGQVYGTEAEAVLGGGYDSDRRSNQDTMDRNDRIVALYDQRASLVMDAPRVARQGLREQVVYALHIDEIDATLDALTDGAVTGWLAGQEN